MQTYTHFRTVFDVSPAADVDNPWAALVGQVRAWIVSKEKDALKGFFFNGGAWVAPPPKRARVETRIVADGEATTPQMWAVRYEHADSAVRLRTWTTNVAVTQVNQREWRLAVELTHRLKPGFIGKEPAAPTPSSPRLIRELIESKNWISRIGSVRLTVPPKALHVGKAHEFAELLRDSRRLVPVVLVSCERKTGVPKIDSGALSRALAGTAVVYYAESTECDQELTHFLPMTFRSPNGTVRIYAPGVDFAKEWTSSRHRFFTGKEIEEQGEDEIIGQIVRALTRSDGWRGIQSSITSIDDIEARVRERRLGELRAANSSSGAERQEMLDLAVTLNDSLTEENRRLKDDLKAESTKLLDAEDDLARRDYDLRQARESVDEAKSETRAAREALTAVRELNHWPETVGEVADLAVRLAGGRVTFIGTARRDLEKSDFAKCKEAPSVVWRCLRAMADDLHDLLSAGLQAQQVAEDFKKRSKFDLTWTESKQTNKDRKFAEQRTVERGGRRLDVTPHIKWDNGTEYLRVHFCVERDGPDKSPVILIGHCGDHLDTNGTRRRK